MSTPADQPTQQQVLRVQGKFLSFLLNRNAGVFAVFVAIIALTAVVLLSMGRTPFGPDGVPGLWSGDI